MTTAEPRRLDSEMLQRVVEIDAARRLGSVARRRIHVGDPKEVAACHIADEHSLGMRTCDVVEADFLRVVAQVHLTGNFDDGSGLPVFLQFVDYKRIRPKEDLLQEKLV